MNRSSFIRGEDDEAKGSQPGCTVGLFCSAWVALSQGQVLGWFTLSCGRPGLSRSAREDVAPARLLHVSAGAVMCWLTWDGTEPAPEARVGGNRSGGKL